MIKNCFLLFCFIVSSSALISQDTCALNIVKDQFDGKRKISTGFIILRDGYFDKIFTYAEKVGSRIEFYISVTPAEDAGSGPHCFQPGSKAIFLFSDDDKATIVSSRVLNCDGSLSFYCSLSAGKTNSQAFNKMAKKTIKSIRFYSTDGYFDVHIDGEDVKQAEQLQKAVQCIIQTK